MTGSASDRPRPTVVIVPVRGLEGAKSRLGEALDAEERRDLVEQLLRHTIATSQATPGVTEVGVISPDPDALDLAAAIGARPILQRSRGLNPAILEARAVVPAGARLLILPSDLPALSQAALHEVLEAADVAGPPCVVIAPDRHGRGTNVLLLDPPDVIDPAFGGDSRAAHAWLASSGGAAFIEVEGDLGLDVDTPDDLLLADGPARAPADEPAPAPADPLASGPAARAGRS
jgi:2-phospho-L-lactate/phosphoenolpyruvate guanylyltransferase